MSETFHENQWLYTPHPVFKRTELSPYERQPYRGKISFETIFIGGFGPEWEWILQTMLLKGMGFLSDYPEYNVRELWAHAKLPNGQTDMKNFKDTRTGAIQWRDKLRCEWNTFPPGHSHLVNAIVCHLSLIQHRGGYAGWIAASKKENPGRIFTFDGSVKSCEGDPDYKRQFDEVKETLASQGVIVADDTGRSGDSVQD